MSQKITPGDVVLHRPSGEEWLVLGVREARDELYPAGWPSTRAKLSDCELVEQSAWLPDGWKQSRANEWGGIVFDDETDGGDCA